MRNVGHRGTLTVTNRVAGRGADGLLCLFFVTNGARQAGIQGAFPVRVGIVHALLTQSVMIVFAVRKHSLADGAHGAGLTVAGYLVEVEVVLADADGVVGVRARRHHPHQACALGARPALLRVAVVLGEGLACRCGRRRGGDRD